jgi:hypothetical protein
MARLVFLVCAVLASPALADVVHLRNGRAVEGEILERDERGVTIRVRGGVMTLPKHMIAEVEARARPQDEYAQRYAELDKSDPEAIEALSLWASSRGLTKESRSLHQLSLGVRLDSMVKDAHKRDSARSWLAVFEWGLRNDISAETLRWLLDQAAELEPGADRVRRAHQALQRELAQRARRNTRPPPRPRHYPKHEEDPRRVAKIRTAREAQRQTNRGQPAQGRVSVTSGR